MLTIELPWPSSELSPNARLFWAVVFRAKKLARQIAKMNTLQAIGYKLWFPDGKFIPVSLEFYPPSRRQFDTDNLVARCKAYLDGVADALEVNDNRFELGKPVRGEVVKGGKVIVRIGEQS